MPKSQSQRNYENLGQITPGSLVDLEVITPTSSKRVKTEYIGLSKERFVLLSYPAAKRAVTLNGYLKDGCTVIVRAVLESGGGQVIAFRQQVVSITSHPTKLLFIGFPEQVQLISLRAQPRIPTLIPAKLISEQQEIAGIIKDVSVNGILFDVKSKENFSHLKNTTCKVTLDSKTSGVTEFEGEICSVRARTDSVQFGIQLLASEGDMKTFMQNHFIDISALEPFL